MATVIDVKYTEELITIFEALSKSCWSNYSRVAANISKDGKPVARQSFFRMVKNGSLRATALFMVLDVLGVKLVFEKDGNEIFSREPRKIE